MRKDIADTESVYRDFAEYYDIYVAGFQADLELYAGPVKPGLKALEIGCGSGRVLKPLLEAGAAVVGVDISPHMLALAENKLRHYCDGLRDKRLRISFAFIPFFSTAATSAQARFRPA